MFDREVKNPPHHANIVPIPAWYRCRGYLAGFHTAEAAVPDAVVAAGPCGVEHAGTLTSAAHFPPGHKLLIHAKLLKGFWSRSSNTAPHDAAVLRHAIRLLHSPVSCVRKSARILFYALLANSCLWISESFTFSTIITSFCCFWARRYMCSMWLNVADCNKTHCTSRYSV